MIFQKYNGYWKKDHFTGQSIYKDEKLSIGDKNIRDGSLLLFHLFHLVRVHNVLERLAFRGNIGGFQTVERDQNLKLEQFMHDRDHIYYSNWSYRFFGALFGMDIFQIATLILTTIPTIDKNKFWHEWETHMVLVHFEELLHSFSDLNF